MKKVVSVFLFVLMILTAVGAAPMTAGAAEANAPTGENPSTTISVTENSPVQVTLKGETDVWLKYTPAQSAFVRFEFDRVSGYLNDETYCIVYQNQVLDENRIMGFSANAMENEFKASASVVAGKTYYICVNLNDDWDPSSTSVVKLTVQPLAVKALKLATDYTTTSTFDTNDPELFSYTADTDMTVAFYSESSARAIIMGNGYQDYYSSDYSSCLFFEAKAGVPVYLSIKKYSSESGAFSIKNVPVADITLGSVVNNTVSKDVPIRLYRYTAASDQAVDFYCEKSYAMRLLDSNLSEVDYSDTSGHLTFIAKAGEVYYIQYLLDSSRDSEPFTLSLKAPVVKPLSMTTTNHLHLGAGEEAPYMSVTPAESGFYVIDAYGEYLELILSYDASFEDIDLTNDDDWRVIQHIYMEKGKTYYLMSWWSGNELPHDLTLSFRSLSVPLLEPDKSIKTSVTNENLVQCKYTAQQTTPVEISLLFSVDYFEYKIVDENNQIIESYYADSDLSVRFLAIKGKTYYIWARASGDSEVCETTIRLEKLGFQTIAADTGFTEKVRLKSTSRYFQLTVKNNNLLMCRLSNAYDAYISIYDKDFNLIKKDTNLFSDKELFLEVKKGETYYIAIGSHSIYEYGDVTVTISEVTMEDIRSQETKKIENQPVGTIRVFRYCPKRSGHVSIDTSSPYAMICVYDAETMSEFAERSQWSDRWHSWGEYVAGQTYYVVVTADPYAESGAASLTYDITVDTNTEFSNDTFRYSLNDDDEATILSYWGSDDQEEIDVPDTIDGYKVTAIGTAAYANNGRVRTVRIPSGVREIGEQAFINCYWMTAIYIPASVTTIKAHAFGERIAYDPGIGSEYFETIDDFTVYGVKGSAAERYAAEYGFSFVETDDQPAALRGDYDGDNDITIMDATRAQNIIAELIVRPDAAYLQSVDADGDKDLTIMDATRIQRVLAELCNMDGSPYTGA